MTPTFALHFQSALLHDGWAADVRVEIAAGKFLRITRDTAPQSGDERVALGLPGMSNVHSHGFQRGMAGLTEFRGPEADNFWSWRTLMYRFVARMTPEDIGAINHGHLSVGDACRQLHGPLSRKKDAVLGMKDERGRESLGARAACFC